MAFKEKIINSYNKVKESIKGNDKIKNIGDKLKDNKIGKKISEVKLNKNQKIIICSTVTLSMVGVGAFFLQGNEKDRTINDISNILQKGNNKALAKLLTIENLNKDLNAEDVKPVMEFYDENKNRVSDLVSALKNGKSIYSMSLKEEKGVLGKDYVLSTRCKELTIKTDTDGATLYINGKSEGVIKGGEKKIKLLAPGSYDIKLEYHGKEANLINEKEITLTDNESISMPLNGIKVSVKTKYEDGIILINDKDTGVKAKDFKEKGPFPTDGSYKISMKYNTPWGEVSSEKIEIKKNPEVIIDLELKNEALKNQLTVTMDNFYTSVFNALNKENKEEIKGTTQEVKNKIYSILNEKYFILKNIYKLESVDVDLNKTNIKLEGGEYTGTVVAKVNYMIKKDMFGIPLQSKSVEQNFFLEVVYKNDAWTIANVENFTLEQ